jgi:hypothetical protein
MGTPTMRVTASPRRRRFDECVDVPDRVERGFDASASWRSGRNAAPLDILTRYLAAKPGCMAGANGKCGKLKSHKNIGGGTVEQASGIAELNHPDRSVTDDSVRFFRPNPSRNVAESRTVAASLRARAPYLHRYQ